MRGGVVWGEQVRIGSSRKAFAITVLVSLTRRSNGWTGCVVRLQGIDPQLQALFLHGMRGTVPDSVLNDAIDARMAVTQYELTGIPWYLATCSEHIARIFIQGARFAGAMHFIDHRWTPAFAEEHLSRTRHVRQELEDRVRSQAARLSPEFSHNRDDAIDFAINGALRPLLASDNPSHLATRKAGIACYGLAEIYREVVAEFYANLKFSPPHGFPEPIFEFHSVERPETWMGHLFAREFSASAQVPFADAVIAKEWMQSVEWGTAELAGILEKIDFNPEEIGRATIRICGFLVSLSGVFMLLRNSMSTDGATAEGPLLGVVVGAVLVVNPELGLNALEAMRSQAN